jgi:hypothetical protein
MVKNAGSEGSRSMANTAILGRHQVGADGLTRGFPNIACMTLRAIVHDASMIEDGVREIIRVMANPAIFGGCRVRGGGRLVRRINTTTTVVTGCTGLYRGFYQAVVENAAHAKADDTMAGTTIDRRYWMTVRWPDCVDAMAEIAAEVCHIRGGVVGVCVQESFYRMTGYAVRTGDRVSAGRDVGGSRCLADGCATVVTTGAATRNTRVIEFTVRAKFKKTGGIVTAVALGAGRLMKL